MSRTVLALDPGTRQSAIAIWDGKTVQEAATIENLTLLMWIRLQRDRARGGTLLAIERVASYGMPVGREVFDTVFWAGRFAEAYHVLGGEFFELPRLRVKQHLCHDSRAKDANIRQALVDRFGGKEAAIGKKASPGPLYMVKGDAWAALALAITVHDTHATPAVIRPAPENAA